MSRRRRFRLARTFVVCLLVIATGWWLAGLVGDNGAPETSSDPHASRTPSAGASGSSDRRTSPFASAAWLPAATGRGHLAPGSDPSVLPGPILVADKRNNRLLIVDPQGRVRWRFPRAGDLPRRRTFQIPDDAFFSPDGREVIATQEDDFVITIIDIETHRIVYRYGHPGVPGLGANQLNNPDDAMLLPDGTIVTADIRNCRLLVIAKGSHAPERVIGKTMNACLHAPPHRWGSPNGAFPMHNGNWIVTEISGDWIDELDAAGHVLWSTHPPGVAYPSDSNEVSPGRYLTVDYSSPGQVVEFNRHGRVLWRFAPTGVNALDKPSLALPLPNGMVLLNDDANHRVIVVDPKTDRVVWQYGHTGTAGRKAGYLNTPDGVDLVAPYSLLGTHAKTLTAP